jgi:hypothetical protein
LYLQKNNPNIIVLTAQNSKYSKPLFNAGVTCIDSSHSIRAESTAPTESRASSAPAVSPQSDSTRKPIQSQSQARESLLPIGSLTHQGTIRSGQQIFASDRSLVVVGNIHHGAELIADGDITVFGKLQGRAVAGLGTQQFVKETSPITMMFKNRRCNVQLSTFPYKIYATHFDPALVCIHSGFVVLDNLAEVVKRKICGKALCVSVEQLSFVDGEKLCDGTEDYVALGDLYNTQAFSKGVKSNDDDDSVVYIYCEDGIRMKFSLMM